MSRQKFSMGRDFFVAGVGMTAFTRLGATEPCAHIQQRRGKADKRQVECARLALQHKLGLGRELARPVNSPAAP
jgi:hypothetical protein